MIGSSWATTTVNLEFDIQTFSRQPNIKACKPEISPKKSNPQTASLKSVNWRDLKRGGFFFFSFLDFKRLFNLPRAVGIYKRYHGQHPFDKPQGKRVAQVSWVTAEPAIKIVLVLIGQSGEAWLF